MVHSQPLGTSLIMPLQSSSTPNPMGPSVSQRSGALGCTTPRVSSQSPGVVE